MGPATTESDSMLGISAKPRFPRRAETSAWRFALGAVASVLISCGGGAKVPPPESALEQYVTAVQKGDADTLRSMMTREARSEYTVSEIRHLLERDVEEFRARARDLSRVPQAELGEATVYLRGGRSAALRLRDGRFWVKSAGLVPEMPRTPEEAAEYLREAIEARDYAKIERTLTDEARKDYSRAFERLEESLSQLDTAIVHVRQDEATIEFLDGRVISLKRQGAAWRVESFE